MNDITPKNDFVYLCQPDCSVFARPVASDDSDPLPPPPPITGYDASRVEFVVEFKSSPSHDPFVVPNKQSSKRYPLISTTATAHEVVGQITAYAAQILSSQYRTHLFTILICKDSARLIRWDRAGAIVTEPISYDNDSYLHDFLTRYDDATPKTRGHDSTVADAHPKDVKCAKSVVPELTKENSFLLITIPDGSPTPKHYVVPRPRARHDIPTGRWTRASIAYDVQRNQRVFLKDSWRVLIDGVKPEGEVYDMLHKNQVPNVPRCSLGRDIGDQLHRSYTDTVVETYIGYNPPCFTPHRHYRLVLDTIGEKLHEFKTSRQMVKAVRAAVHGKCRRFCNVL